jgi:hypothetical protein
MIKARDNRFFSSSRVSHRDSYPVVRVLTPWRGGRSAHLIGALKAYLSCPGQPLPPDPGPGSGYPIAARLDRRLVAKAKAMAGESSQAALIRRVLLWRYFQKPVAGSTRPNPSAMPVSNPARVTVQPERSPGVNDVPASKNLSDQEYIRRLYEGKI